MRPCRSLLLLPALVLLLAGCRTAAPGPDVPPSPSDWEISLSREIDEEPRRTIGSASRGIWVSNELEGGRASDVRFEGDSLVVVRIDAENTPVNSSAWYAFRIHAESPDTIRVRLDYPDGRHRYWPKIGPGHPDAPTPPEAWVAADSAQVELRPEEESMILTLAVGPEPIIVAGQELLTSRWFGHWVDGLAARSGVERSTIGTSARGRPIELVQFGNPAATRHVVLISRQHPPEVTGTLALVRYVEELLGDGPLATDFREGFRVHLVPLVNPDGVDLGHWRHNSGGVDLNRDWVAFHQPETRLVRDTFRELLGAPEQEVWFFADFHSTNRDVFFTLDRRLPTTPPEILDPWLEGLRAAVPQYDLPDAPSGLATPMSRNWFYREFAAPGLIYEVGDHTDRSRIAEVAEAASRAMMEVLIARSR